MDEHETPSATNEYAAHTSRLRRVFAGLRTVEELDLQVVHSDAVLSPVH